MKPILVLRPPKLVHRRPGVVCREDDTSIAPGDRGRDRSDMVVINHIYKSPSTIEKSVVSFATHVMSDVCDKEVHGTDRLDFSLAARIAGFVFACLALLTQHFVDIFFQRHLSLLMRSWNPKES